MTNLQKILIGAGIIGGAIIGTPIIYNSGINKFIQQEKITLQQQQIEVKESKNSDSFFTTNREFIVTIKDSTPLIQQLYPQIDYWTLNSLKANLDNTQFLVKLNLTKFPLYHKDAVKIELYSLNDSLQKELESDEIGKQLLNAIKKGVFETILDVNNLKISKARLKDINLNLKDRNSKFKFKLQNFVANVEKDELSISQFALNSADSFGYKNSIVINNLTAKTKEQNFLNYTSNLKIGSIDYMQNFKFDNIKLSVKNFENYSKLTTILNKSSIKNVVKIKSFNFNDDSNLIKVENFKYNLFVMNLYSKALKNIIGIVENSIYSSPEILFTNVETLIQNGFKVEISPLSFDSAEIVSGYGQKFELKPLKIEAEVELSKNNYNLMTEPPEVLLDEVNGKLEIMSDKDNIELLNNNFPLFSLYFRNLFKEENNKVILNLEYRKGEITSNGKPIFQ